jgi:hypothetical protein
MRIEIRSELADERGDGDPVRAALTMSLLANASMGVLRDGSNCTLEKRGKPHVHIWKELVSLWDLRLSMP